MRSLLAGCGAGIANDMAGHGLAVVDLPLDDADFATGQVLCVSGGPHG